MWLRGVGIIASLAAFAPRAGAQDERTFEALAARAQSVALETLAAPFVEDCQGRRGPVARDRCEASMRFLRDALPKSTFLVAQADPDVVRISDYDARVQGVRVDVAGCLACEQPVQTGSSGQKRYLTLGKPGRNVRNLAEAVPVASVPVRLGGIPETEAWIEEQAPHLRATFVFAPQGEAWNLGARRGLAFRLAGMRLFNRCTGEIHYSDPPSREPVAHAGGPGCGPDGEAAAAADEGATAALAARLSAADISRGMAAIQSAFDACAETHEAHGTASLEIAVAGRTGAPISVQLRGSLAGTPVGPCLVKAARKARFAPFARDSQAFTYPVTLRR